MKKILELNLKDLLLKRYPQLKLSEKSSFFILLLICILGTVIRSQDIAHFLYLDELTTSWVIKGSFIEIFERCWKNNIGPIYYIFVGASKAFFGYSETALRLPSVIAGVLSIPLIYLITKDLSRSKPLALFASFLFAIDPTLVGYSQEVRPYIFVVLFSLLSFYLFLLYLRNVKSVFYIVILGIINGILILTHYTAGIICAVQLVMACVYFIHNKTFSRKKVAELIVYIIIVLLFLLPLVNHLNYLFANREILSNYLPENVKIGTLIKIMLPPFIGYIVAPLLAALVVESWNNDREGINRDFTNNFKFLLLLVWYFIPLAFFWILSGLNILHMLFPRYLVIIIPAQIIGGAILAGSFKSQWARIIYVAVLLFMIQVADQNSVIHTYKTRNTEKHWEWGEYVYKKDYGWKEAVAEVNNSGIVPEKVYVISSLTESQMLNSGIPVDSLLKDYLLSTANAIYCLDQTYLSKSIPIFSTIDIPENGSSYLLIGPRSHLNSSYLKGATEISPKGAYLNVFYKR